MTVTDTGGLITTEMIDLHLEAPDKDSATRHLAEMLLAVGPITDLEGFLADVRAREHELEEAEAAAGIIPVTA